MNEGAATADTLPPTAAESEAVAIFEAAIAKFGEQYARWILFRIKTGDIPLCPNSSSSPSSSISPSQS